MNWPILNYAGAHGRYTESRERRLSTPRNATTNSHESYPYDIPKSHLVVSRQLKVFKSNKYDSFDFACCYILRKNYNIEKFTKIRRIHYLTAKFSPDN